METIAWLIQVVLTISIPCLSVLAWRRGLRDWTSFQLCGPGGVGPSGSTPLVGECTVVSASIYTIIWNHFEELFDQRRSNVCRRQKHASVHVRPREHVWVPPFLCCVLWSGVWRGVLTAFSYTNQGLDMSKSIRRSIKETSVWKKWVKKAHDQMKGLAAFYWLFHISVIVQEVCCSVWFNIQCFLLFPHFLQPSFTFKLNMIP